MLRTTGTLCFLAIVAVLACIAFAGETVAVVATDVVPGAATPEPMAVAVAQPLSAATTPAEVRQVLRYCRSATKDDCSELHRMALSEDPVVAGNAITALGRLGAVVDDPEVMALLADPRLRVRQAVIRALGDSGQARAIGHLVPLLADAGADLRPLVIQALGRLGGKEPLRGWLQDPRSTETDRVFALAALDGRPDR